MSSDGEAVIVAVQPIVTSKQKWQKHNFMWEYFHDWQDGDSAKHCGKHQCIVCRKWYSGSTNVSS